MFREDMICDGIENCVQYIENFNQINLNNPLLTLSNHLLCILETYTKEKRQIEIKNKILDKSGYEVAFHTDDKSGSSDYNTIKENADKNQVTYPTTIIDNFFDDPDAIVEMAEGMKYYADTEVNFQVLEQNNYIENHRFFTYFGQKIHNLFHDSCPETWSLQSHFQNIRPFEDKYSKEIVDGYIKTLTHGSGV